MCVALWQGVTMARLGKISMHPARGSVHEDVHERFEYRILRSLRGVEVTKYR